MSPFVPTVEEINSSCMYLPLEREIFRIIGGICFNFIMQYT